MKKITSFRPALMGALLAASAAHLFSGIASAQPTLKAFASEAELGIYFADIRRAEEERQRAERERQAALRRAQSPANVFEKKKENSMAQDQATSGMGAMADAMPAAKMAAPAAAPSMAAESRTGTPGTTSARQEESVTNTQTLGVDEGGIVKVHGNHLVILRRGRLFTVDIAGRNLQPKAMLDAFGPGSAPQGAWYDEMLLTGNTVIVIGYSYARGGTEIGLFSIDGQGNLSYRATYHMRSNDYYSSRSYASRLIGSKLIFYTPLAINPLNPNPTLQFPAVRRWHGNQTPADFKRIAPANRIYRTDDDAQPHNLALHSVTVCETAGADMQCEATGVLGPVSRNFYVSQGSVYVWTNQQRNRPQNVFTPADAPVSAGVVRIPLDGAAPSALRTMGSPIDQFSFLESPDGHLNVLVRSQGRGEGVWRAEASTGDLALLRVSLRSFGNGSHSAPAAAYMPLPKLGGHSINNRFVGNFLLYGSGGGHRRSGVADQNVHAVRWDQAHSTQAQTLALDHAVERIEALGEHAVVIGAGGMNSRDLHFSSLQLGHSAQGMHRYVRTNAAQGETRSHGFFYKPDAHDGWQASTSQGILGLPVIGGGGRQFNRDSAAVIFLRNQGLALSEIGALEARAGSQVNDGCRASCVDWYGNSRPLFLRGRVFALMGYELVEGAINPAWAENREAISELRRVNYLQPTTLWGQSR